MDVEYKSKFTEMEVWNIELPDKKSNLTFVIRCRKPMKEDKKEYKEMVDYMGQSVKFCLHIETDSKFIIEGTGDCWVHAKHLTKCNNSLIDISLTYDKVLHKKAVDLWRHQCVLYLEPIQPELITQGEE